MGYSKEEEEEEEEDEEESNAHVITIEGGLTDSLTDVSDEASFYQ